MAKKIGKTRGRKKISNILTSDPKSEHEVVPSAWDSLNKSQERLLKLYIKGYSQSLQKKTVNQRSEFIRQTLEANGFEPFEKLSGGMPFEMTLGVDNDIRLERGRQFYVTYQDLTIACRVGRRGLKKEFILEQHI